jgi:hypothetical protein
MGYKVPYTMGHDFCLFGFDHWDEPEEALKCLGRDFEKRIPGVCVNHLEGLEKDAGWIISPMTSMDCKKGSFEFH